MLRCVNENCDYYKWYGECSSVCVEGGIKKVVTNFDRIKSMSKKELAQFIMHIRIDGFGTKEIDGELLFGDNDFYAWMDKECELCYDH